MTDLEINIALAKAMGWVEFEWEEWMDLAGNGFITNDGQVLCSYKNSAITYKFDYRNPVIFVAICKHWKLTIFHNSLHCYCAPTLLDFNADTIEKAAALCVIAAAKRGVK
jgi:hypothetical protein